MPVQVLAVEQVEMGEMGKLAQHAGECVTGQAGAWINVTVARMVVCIAIQDASQLQVNVGQLTTTR